MYPSSLIAGLSLCTTLWLLLVPGCSGQPASHRSGEPSPDHRPVIGGPFENREFMFIGMPEQIDAVDTSDGWSQAGQKLLITGTIYHRDGRTPAPGVILYYYHTDIHGYYARRPGLDPRVARHGYIRGWVKSGSDGRYAIYTVRPAPYPNRTMPAHIHPAIKEPTIDEPYYIDELVFDDDRLLTADRRDAMENRGGSGVLRVVESGDLQIAEHDIILGLHIPHHPEAGIASVSGREVGEDVRSFAPYHVWGPDRGTTTCPICRYGRHHGLLFFVGNSPHWPAIERWLRYLERESTKRKELFKAYLVYGNEHEFYLERRKRLEEIGRKLNLKQVALTVVPSFGDQTSDVHLNRINPKVESTILIYRNRTIIDKYIDFPPTGENFTHITRRLDRTQSEFADLPEPRHP